MKEKLKYYAPFAILLLALWVATHYWDAAIAVAHNLFSVASPLLIGFCIAYVVNILMTFYEGIWNKSFRGEAPERLDRVRRFVCMLLAFTTVVVIAYALLRMVLPEVWRASGLLISQVSGLLEQGQSWLVERNLLDSEQLAQLSSRLEDWTGTLLGWVSTSAASVVTGALDFFSSVANLFISLVFSIYLLMGKEQLIEQVNRVMSLYVPERASKVIYRVAHVANESFHNYIVGQCIEAVVLGTLCTLGMLLLGMPYAVMTGSVVGVTALIPFAGAYIGATVGAIMIATVSPWQALAFIGYLVVLQQIEGNLIYPQVAGRTIGLPGIWIIAAVTIGGGLGGIPGMILAVPLTATFYHLFRADIHGRTAERAAAASAGVVSAGAASATPTAPTDSDVPASSDDAQTSSDDACELAEKD